MTRRTAPALLALACASGLLASGLVVSAAPPGAAAVARCDGRVATLVVSNAPARGTSGDDVIVLVGPSSRVDAGAGDDRICVRGRGRATSVIAGPGDDRVLVESRTSVFADLRAGVDTFRGGSGDDLVVSGTPGVRGRDRIFLRGGSDTVVLTAGRDHRRGVLSGGAGDDLLRVVRRSGLLTVDAGAGVATVEGATYARWGSFESYGLSSGSRQSFLGGPGDDDVSFEGRGGVEALTGGGDDVVRVRHEHGPTDRVPGTYPARAGWRFSVDTGVGRDRLEVRTSARSVVGDLVADRIDVADADGPVDSLPFAGVEDLTVRAPVEVGQDDASRVRLVGDDGDNRLWASGCNVTLDGAAGDDHLRAGDDGPEGVFITAGGLDRGCRRSAQVLGGPGDDTLVSRVIAFDFRGVEVGETVHETELRSTDVLDGGEGTDSADAGAGQDTCVAENRVHCEA